MDTNQKQKIRELFKKMIEELDVILDSNNETLVKIDEILENKNLKPKVDFIKEEQEEENSMKTRKPVEQTMYYRILDYLKWNEMKTYAEIGKNTNITEKGTKDEIDRMRQVKGFGQRFIVDGNRVGLDKETKRMPTSNIVRLMKECNYRNPVHYTSPTYHKSNTVNPEDISTF